MPDHGTLPACFRAYDIRGRVPEELDEALAYDIARAYACFTRPCGAVAVGADVRMTSRPLAEAVISGLVASGVDTVDLGLCGTELVYFAAAQPGSGGGIMVTASHNPAEYNGLKLVRAGAEPISADTGLLSIAQMVASGGLPAGTRRGVRRNADLTEPYVDAVVSFIDPTAVQGLRVLASAGNGCAGPVARHLAERLRIHLLGLDLEPDGTFPHGVPNPMLPERRERTADAMRSAGCDLGVAWDGDFDRCFFFDERGVYAESYYVVGLIARWLLGRSPGQRIVHDSRLLWDTIEVVSEAGGIPVQHRTGHAFMKERLRAEAALYGGDPSAHHYFRDFFWSDSGMIPWLLMMEMLRARQRPLSEIVAERESRYPCSGEINRDVTDQAATMDRVRAHYEPYRPSVDETDGLSMAFGDRWRFNLRPSNTEPLLRLNVETRGDRALLGEKTTELLAIIDTS